MSANRHYSINVYDCAGEFVGRSAVDFAEALSGYREYRAKYPGKMVQVFNLDRCDYNSDGLTEDERDAIETEDAARAAIAQVSR